MVLHSDLEALGLTLLLAVGPASSPVRAGNAPSANGAAVVAAVPTAGGVSRANGVAGGLWNAREGSPGLGNAWSSFPEPDTCGLEAVEASWRTLAGQEGEARLQDYRALFAEGEAAARKEMERLGKIRFDPDAPGRAREHGRSKAFLAQRQAYRAASRVHSLYVSANAFLQALPKAADRNQLLDRSEIFFRITESLVAKAREERIHHQVGITILRFSLAKAEIELDALKERREASLEEPVQEKEREVRALKRELDEGAQGDAKLTAALEDLDRLTRWARLEEDEAERTEAAPRPVGTPGRFPDEDPREPVLGRGV